jgi:hypothetical protein
LSLENLFREYMFEEYEAECVEIDGGFAFVNFIGDECLIRDFKAKGKGMELFNKVKSLAKEKQMTHLSCCLAIGRRGRWKEDSRKARGYLNLGFEIVSTNNNYIVFKYGL